MRRSSLTVVVAAGSLALALSACGGPEADEAAATGTAGSAGAEEAPAAEEEAPATAADLLELSTAMQAAQDEAGTAHVEMTYGGELAETAGLAGSTQSMDVRFGPTIEETAMSMSMDMAGMAMEMVLVDGVMYMDMSALSGTPGWVEMPLDELEGDEALGSTLTSMESMDAAAQAELVADAVTSFEHTGTEQENGQDVDVYEVTVDPTKLSADAGGLGAAAAGTAELGEMTMVYRVTPEGLLSSADTVTAVDGQEMTMTMTYSGWGEPVTIEAPPADQVTSFEDAMGGAAG